MACAGLVSKFHNRGAILATSLKGRLQRFEEDEIFLDLLRPSCNSQSFI